MNDNDYSETVKCINQELANFPILKKLILSYLADREHPMNIVGYLLNPATRNDTLKCIQNIAEVRDISEDEFQQIVDQNLIYSSYILQANDEEFNLFNGQRNSQVLKEILLEQNPDLYSIGTNLTETQNEILQEYVLKLNLEILPELQEMLMGLSQKSQKSDPEGICFAVRFFPKVNQRAKASQGIVDKIQRMRTGNAGKDPRPSYCLADMPDAVGGRITTEDIKQLEQVMQEFEKEFADIIIEKDNFYCNPRKKQKSYRVITYTILVGGVPCEVQLTTLHASLAADLNHNVVYKPIIQATEEDREYVKEFTRKSVVFEIESL